MTSPKLTSIIKYLIYLLALTPLIVTPFTIFPFNFGRGLVVQLLIELIFGFYIFLAIFDKNYRPKINAMTIILGIFLGILYLSSFFGVDFHRSFWSNEQRFTGLFYISHMFAFFVVLTSVFKTKKEWNSFLGFNVLVAGFVYVIAMLSFFGVRFWGVDLGTRISGTIGNPIFAATYFIFNLVFALHLLFSIKNKNSKIFYVIFSFVLLCGVIFSQSMGALLGAIAGIILGLVVYALFSKNKKAIIVIFSGIFIFAFSFSSVIANKDTEFIKDNKILNRISHISISSETVNTRIMNWKVAINAISERPVLGWGMEAYKIAFNKYYNPEFLKYSYYETWPDKPHNKILEVASDAGFVGLSAYFVLFAYSCFVIWKKRRKRIISIATASILAGGLTAYFVQNLFIFDTTISYLLFFIFLSFIVFENKEDIKEFKKIPALFFAIFTTLVLIVSFFINISPLLVGAKLRSSFPLMDIKQKINLENYEDAKKYFNPYQKEWRTDLAKSVISALRRGDAIYNQKEIDFALTELNDYVKKHSNSAYTHLLLGIFYGELGVLDEKYFDLAKNELDKTLKLSPGRQHIYFAYGRVYALMGDNDRFIGSFDKAIELEPNAPLSYWEAGKQLYVAEPDNELYKEYLVEAAKLIWVPEEKNEFLFLFKNTHDYFIETKDYYILLNYYQKMQEIEPKNAKWYANGAVAAYFLNYFERAIELIKEAMALDESYKNEGKEFIRMIEEEVGEISN